MQCTLKTPALSGQNCASVHYVCIAVQLLKQLICTTITCMRNPYKMSCCAFFNSPACTLKDYRYSKFVIYLKSAKCVRDVYVGELYTFFCIAGATSTSSTASIEPTIERPGAISPNSKCLYIALRY